MPRQEERVTQTGPEGTRTHERVSKQSGETPWGKILAAVGIGAAGTYVAINELDKNQPSERPSVSRTGEDIKAGQPEINPDLAPAGTTVTTPEQSTAGPETGELTWEKKDSVYVPSTEKTNNIGLIRIVVPESTQTTGSVQADYLSKPENAGKTMSEDVGRMPIALVILKPEGTTGPARHVIACDNVESAQLKEFMEGGEKVPENASVICIKADVDKYNIDGAVKTAINFKGLPKSLDMGNGDVFDLTGKNVFYKLPGGGALVPLSSAVLPEDTISMVAN